MTRKRKPSEGGTSPGAALLLERVRIDAVTPDPLNKRTHDERNVRAIAESLTRFGQQTPIVIDEQGVVLKGNGTLEAARSLGWTEIDAVRTSLTKREAEAYAVADNRTADLAGWQERELADFLVALHNLDELEGVGYTEEDIDALLAKIEEEGQAAGNEVDDPGPSEPPATPVTETGDLWLLGDHRVVCGDSTDKGAVALVMGGAQADILWTDPPYGVSYVGKTADALEIENDGLQGAELSELLRGAFAAADAACRPGACWYVAAPAGPQFLEFAAVLAEMGIWRQTLAWVKDVFVMGHSDFHYKHESLLYGWVEGAAHRPPPDRTQDTVWEFDRPKASREHPTMKPLGLVCHSLEMSSGPGALAIDPFLGSGTTLIACEQLGRKCYGIEISPAYVDVIVRRWQDATGREATLESTGETFAETAVTRGREAA
ncbi:MAG: site-specific DNA-methyltransferase [bacterium]|nr:site-specific DNA-methyltransferase [bacterium]